MPSWSFTDTFLVPRSPVTWDSTREWAPSFAAVVHAASAQLHATLAEWDEKLAALGGDPARQDWSSFRPLRRSREEDWSDWLAYLLQVTRTGRFAARLLGGVEDVERWRVRSVDREVVAEGYRADLVVRFTNGDAAHVEVKIGDRSLAKTVDTGRALRRVERKTSFRDDYLLLPESDLALWDEEKNGIEGADAIQVRTWTDVARALRRSLVEEGELMTWRAWAFAFLGAVEQHLLGFEPISTQNETGHRRPSPMVLRRLELLRQAST